MNIASIRNYQNLSNSKANNQQAFRANIQITEPAAKSLKNRLSRCYSLFEKKFPEQTEMRFLGKDFNFEKQITAFIGAINNVTQDLKEVNIIFDKAKNGVSAFIYKTGEKEARGALLVENADLLQTPMDKGNPISFVAKQYRKEIDEILK